MCVMCSRKKYMFYGETGLFFLALIQVTCCHMHHSLCTATIYANWTGGGDLVAAAFTTCSKFIKL